MRTLQDDTCTEKNCLARRTHPSNCRSVPKLPPVKRFVANNGVRVYRIPCQVLPYLSARVYLLLGAGPPTLVDTGSGQDSSTRDILAGLEAVRTDFGEPIQPGDIGRILITHTHSDHIGGLSDMLRQTSAEVVVHALECRRITACRESAVLAERALQRFLKHAGVLQETLQRSFSQHGRFPTCRDPATLQGVNDHLGTGLPQHVGKAADMVAVCVRNQDSADVTWLNRLAEVGSHGFQPGQDVASGTVLPAARVDQRWRASAKQEVHAGAQVG